MSYFKSTLELRHLVGKLDYIYPSFFYLSLQHCNSSYEALRVQLNNYSKAACHKLLVF